MRTTGAELDPGALRQAPVSAIRTAARSLAGSDIDLTLGEPTWFHAPQELPGVARRALASASDAPYGAHAGDVELRRAIAAYEGAHEDEILVTSGAQGALFALAQATLGEGTVALVPDPGFPAYGVLARLTGASVRTYGLSPDFQLDAHRVLAALNAEPRARVPFLNHPSNPTGSGQSQDALATIVAACRQRGVLVISDEVYRELHAGKRPIAARDVASEVVGVSSLSKSCGAPGLRIGWLVADPQILEACRGWHAWAVTSASWPAQQAARAMLDARDEVFTFSRREVARRWRAVEATFRSELGWAPARPAAGFYLWLATGGLDSTIFCQQLSDAHGVAVMPGSAFGRRGEGWVRISLAAPVEQVVQGARGVARFLSQKASAR